MCKFRKSYNSWTGLCSVLCSFDRLLLNVALQPLRSKIWNIRLWHSFITKMKTRNTQVVLKHRSLPWWRWKWVASSFSPSGVHNVLLIMRLVGQDGISLFKFSHRFFPHTVYNDQHIRKWIVIIIHMTLQIYSTHIKSRSVMDVFKCLWNINTNVYYYFFLWSN